MSAKDARAAPAAGLVKPPAGREQELDRLRHANAIHSQIVASLRAVRERERQQVDEHTTILAAACKELQAQWLAHAEQIGAAEVRSANATDISALIDDVHDFTCSLAGALAPERESVHLETLLERVAFGMRARSREGGSRRDVWLARNCPERIFADPRLLSKLLLYVAGSLGEEFHGHCLLIEATRGRETSDSSVGNIESLEITLSAHPATLAPVSAKDLPPACMALRNALGARLADLMDIEVQRVGTGTEHWQCLVTIPYSAAGDPVAADELHRIRDNGLQGTGIFCDQSSPPTNRTDLGSHADNGAIDRMYLDRQLGSLAPEVLARAAPLFISLTEQRLTALAVAQELGDLPQLRERAQAWKAAAMNIGAQRLAAVLTAVEKQASAGQVVADSTMQQLREAVERVHAALAILEPASRSKSP